ncbi:MAG: hypothetical protein K940chlam7_01468 [Chlamydiae bacterium]|nr:hypothetical protein [Chlamydiota bacterium]
MHDNQKRLKKRALQAAEEALYKKQYVSPIDVFVGMKLLQPVHVEDWRKGRIPCLERVIQGSLSKITFCMKCFRAWAKEKELKPSITAYLARTSGPKRELRFSASGNPNIEQSYRTHYVSPVLSEKKQKKLQEKLDKPPEQVVFRTVRNSQCSRCEKELHKGSFLFMEADQPLCLCCANLNELEYLPRGNAKLRARAEISCTFLVTQRFRCEAQIRRQLISFQEFATKQMKMMC